MSIQCWSGEHLYLAVPIAMSFIVLWSIIFPAYIWYQLYRRRQQLNELQNLNIYGLFYVGLNDKSFYWEIVITNLRKIVFITCATLMSSVNPQHKVLFTMTLTSFQVLVGMIMLFIYTQLATSNPPYISPTLNSVDFHATYASVYILF